MTVKGVDISEMNGSVDFQALKAAGVEFVLIRCGYGGDYLDQDDERFAENVRKADTAGIPWGAYLYSYATDAGMARDEAQHTLRLLNGRKPAYGVWCDVEDAQQSESDLVSICETYCESIQAAGLYCGIYSMLSWLNGKLNSSRLDKYDKWVADWDTSCGYRKPYGIWQYSDRGIIGGKTFDMNLAYKDYPALTGNTGKDEDDMTDERVLEIIRKYEADKAKKPASGWAEEALAYGREHRIMAGDAENGSLRPQDEITRQEVMQMLYNVLRRYRTIEEVPEWGRETVQRLMDLGVVKGTGKDQKGRVLLDMSEIELRTLCWMVRYLEAISEPGIKTE